ncbi:MAG TPA: tRNA pseudouridine(55) synthase TruB, partial [Gammaproteobacteria bacterium]|nr:tRNA pseudouridine(55) synthase TruB [Gammaproteobacteria bacterium]
MSRRRSKGRAVNGILLLDKPLGITSNKALQMVKRLFNARKAGHTGNLDPMASGVLPLCLGEATKMSAFLLDADKRYRGTVKLGVRTSSADAEGEVIERLPVPALQEQQIREVLTQFVGEIEQIPPMYS